MQKAIISTQEISQHFIQGSQEIIVLKTIDSTFTQEKSSVITGVSGSGKSTFIHIIAGLEKPTKGTVFFNSLDIYSLSPSDLSQFLNKKIGLLFQSPYLLRELSVIENVMLPGLIQGTSHADCQKRAEYLLEKVDVYTKKDSLPGELSGGQQQRVALARALCNEPAFLIADEPTSNLDKKTGEAIINLLLSLHKEFGMGLILSSHDEYVTEQMDVLYTLDQGKLRIQEVI